MTYWLHRISHHAEVSYPLLDRNILTIGFSDFAKESFVEEILAGQTWQERWESLELQFDSVWGERPRTRHNLWRFIEGFKKEDIIVVPSWKKFSVYKIASDRPQIISQLEIDNIIDWHGNSVVIGESGLLTSNEPLDIGFFWEVDLVAKEIPRNEFADSSLTSRMKIRLTNANINDISNSVDKAIQNFRTNSPINLYSEIIKSVVPEIQRIINSQLNPDKFEKLVKYYFENNGATQVYIPAKNESGKEGDADVIAVYEKLKIIIYAQVKFHGTESETNEWAVEQIKSYKSNKDTMDDSYSKIAWVVSAANNFTIDCIKLAGEAKIQLIDGATFSEMLVESGLINLKQDK